MCHVFAIRFKLNKLILSASAVDCFSENNQKSKVIITCHPRWLRFCFFCFFNNTITISTQKKNVLIHPGHCYPRFGLFEKLDWVRFLKINRKDINKRAKQPASSIRSG